MSENVYESPKAMLQPTDEEAVAVSNKELLFSFEGRIKRGQFWLGTLMLFGILFGGVIVLSLLPFSDSVRGLGILLLYIPVLWASFAIQTKRWHDRNKSGWWILINFVPFIGGIWAFIETGCLAGDDTSNNYGPPPM